jgi:regulator of replication initiation timing
MVRPLKIKNNQGKIKANVIIPMHQGDKIMKKPLSIILTIILIISIVGNITLYLQLNKVNSNNQDLNNSIVEIQDSISDLENQLSDVQEQLSDSTIKNGELQENNDSLQSELEQLQSEVEFLKSIEPMSVTMYALEDCDTYSKPDESSDKVTTVEKSASLHVTGRTSNDWYRVEWGNGVVYIKASLLSDTKPTAPTGSSNSGTTNNNNSESTNEPTNPTPNNNNTLNQENVGDILDGLFGPSTGGYTPGGANGWDTI